MRNNNNNSCEIAAAGGFAELTDWLKENEVRSGIQMRRINQI